MKKVITLSFLLLIVIKSYSIEVDKTIECTAGTLKESLSRTELNIVNNLKIIGSVNAHDFLTMTEEMISLKKVDLSEATIEATVLDKRSYPENHLPWAAFSEDDLEEFICPRNTITIGSGAFMDCSSLKKVVLNAELEYINNDAFRHCTELSTIVLTENIKHIGSDAFRNCTKLNDINIPKKLEVIQIGAFTNCTANFSVNPENHFFSSLDGVLFNKGGDLLIFCPSSKSGTYEIPLAVKKIENYAFQECTSLNEVTINSNVTEIGGLVFFKSKVHVTVQNSNQHYSSEDGLLFNKEKTQLIYCPNTKTGTYEIPNSVESIHANAFNSCKIRTIKIPESVSKISNQAFHSCSELNAIYNFRQIPVSLSDINTTSYSSAFYGVDTDSCILYVPIECKPLYQLASQWNEFKQIIEFNPTNTPDHFESQINIYSTDGKLFINGLQNNMSISIYNINGVCIKKILSNSSNFQFQFPRNGIFIVKVDNEVRKIVN